MFTVGGLPAHPLLVHAVVVLIPLAALGAIAVAIRPRWNRPYAPLVAFGALTAAVAATLSKLAGEQLLATINVSPEYAVLLGEHGRWGLFTTIASWIFAAFTVATAMLGRGSRDGNAAPRRRGALGGGRRGVAGAGHAGRALRLDVGLELGRRRLQPRPTRLISRTAAR